jgi:hypothetical protein
MVVKVLSKIGQALVHPFDGLSLAEGSMLLRLRRASIALLCLVGAVGLGLVIFISQLGWPDVLSSPLPGGPAKVGKVHDAVALHSPGAAGGGTAARSLGDVTAPRAAKNGKKQTRGTSTSSHVGRSHGLTNAPVATPAPSGPAPSPPTSTPTPSEPAPVVSTPASSSPATAVESEPSSSGAVKASSDSARAAGLAGSKSPGRQSTGGKDPSTSKTNDQAGAKARRDESVVTPPSSAPAPAATSPAAAKEADDAAKAGQGRH